MLLFIIWVVGLLPAILIINWLESDPMFTEEERGNSTTILTIIFWPMTFAVLLVGLIIFQVCSFYDVAIQQKRDDNDK